MPPVAFQSRDPQFGCGSCHTPPDTGGIGLSSDAKIGRESAVQAIQSVIPHTNVTIDRRRKCSISLLPELDLNIRSHLTARISCVAGEPRPRRPTARW